MSVLPVVAAIGLAAVAVGAFLDWVTFELPPFFEELIAQAPVPAELDAIQGTDIMQGKALVALGAIGAVVALVGLTTERARRVSGLVAVAIGTSAVVLVGTDVADVSRIPEVPIPPGAGLGAGLPTEAPLQPIPGPTPQLPVLPEVEETLLQQGGTFGVNPGIGLWVVLVGGLAAVAAGVPLALSREEEVVGYPPPARAPAVPPPSPPPAAPAPRDPDEGPPAAWTPT